MCLFVSQEKRISIFIVLSDRLALTFGGGCGRCPALPVWIWFLQALIARISRGSARAFWDRSSKKLLACATQVTPHVDFHPPFFLRCEVFSACDECYGPQESIVSFAWVASSRGPPMIEPFQCPRPLCETGGRLPCPSNRMPSSTQFEVDDLDHLSPLLRA